MSFRVISERADARWMRGIVDDATTEAEGLKNLYATIGKGVLEDKLSLEHFSFRDIAIACGIMAENESWSQVAQFAFSGFRDQSAGGKATLQRVFRESNANLNTDVFQTLLTDLIDTMAITRDTENSEMVGRSLCTIKRDNKPQRKMAGVTALGTVMPIVHQGHTYNETTFGEKYVDTNAHKFGSVMGVTLEAVMQDDMGMIVDQMNTINAKADVEIETYIMSMLTDQQDANYGYVYKPSGVNTTLYSAGNDNTTAHALQDYTDIDAVWNYRIQNVVTDNVDGAARPYHGINSGRKTMLVPASLYATANRIVNSTLVDISTNSGAAVTRVPNGIVARGLVDQLIYSDVLDGWSTTTWYYGNFQKQFVLRQLLDRQVFTQGSDSEVAFSNDVVFRVKVREYLGVNAVDHPFVTKVTAS